MVQYHGLPAALQVDDGQSGVQQHRLTIPVNAAAVGPPAAHGSKHLFYRGITSFQSDHAGNPTHNDHILSVPQFMYALGENVHNRDGDVQ